MTPEQLAAIREREAAATPGPWGWRGYSNEDPCLFGERTRVVLSVIRRERKAEDPETRSFERYLSECDVSYVDAEGKTAYRPLTDEEIAERVKEEWLEDPWGGPQYDNRLAFRDHRTNIMEYARDIPGLKHPDAAFIEHAREDVPALLAEVERLTAYAKELKATVEMWEKTGETISHHIPEHYDGEGSFVECLIEWAAHANEVVMAAHAWRKRGRTTEDGDKVEAAVERIYPSDDYL